MIPEKREIQKVFQIFLEKDIEKLQDVIYFYYIKNFLRYFPLKRETEEKTT